MYIYLLCVRQARWWRTACRNWVSPFTMRILGDQIQPDDKLLNPLSNLGCICLSCAVNFWSWLQGQSGGWAIMTPREQSWLVPESEARPFDILALWVMPVVCLLHVGGVMGWPRPYVFLALQLTVSHCLAACNSCLLLFCFSWTSFPKHCPCPGAEAMAPLWLPA